MIVSAAWRYIVHLDCRVSGFDNWCCPTGCRRFGVSGAVLPCVMGWRGARRLVFVRFRHRVILLRGERLTFPAIRLDRSDDCSLPLVVGYMHTQQNLCPAVRPVYEQCPAEHKRLPVDKL